MSTLRRAIVNHSRNIVQRNIILRQLRSSKSKAPRPSSNSITTREVEVEEKNPWIAQKDPAGSGLIYYWNTRTNETTALGAARPAHWIEVDDPAGSSLTYWWNPETNETTALGAVKPTQAITGSEINTVIRRPMPFGGIMHQQQQQQQAFQQQQPVSLGKSMSMYFTLGVGMTLGMVMVRMILG